MKLFVYEYITSGALIDDPLPTSLADEGDAMLQALVNDLLLLVDIELILLRDSRLPPLAAAINARCLSYYRVSNHSEFSQFYHAAVNAADAVLPIAPETNKTLLSIQQAVVAAGKQLLLSQQAAIILCSDKYRCYQHLLSHQIATPATIRADQWSANYFNHSLPYIVKPIDGAGCTNTQLFTRHAELSSYLSAQRAILDSLIIQPFIAGTAISLSLLCNDAQCVVLAINQQYIEQTADQLIFRGCRVNGVADTLFDISQANAIANQVHQAIPGLLGFIGIDLIVTKQATLIIDINPRLTTAYIGLARSLACNPAALLTKMLTDNTIGDLDLSMRRAVEVIL